MDFDPRDYDSRDEDRFNGDGRRGGPDSSDAFDCAGDWRQPAASRDRDADARTLGRGPGSSRQGSEAEGDARNRGADVRWPDRERDTRERNDDARHVDYDRRPDRTPEEIHQWAPEHDLPYFGDEVHFPDARIEFEERDGRWDHHDIEVTTALSGRTRGKRGPVRLSCFGIEGVVLRASPQRDRGPGVATVWQRRPPVVAVRG